MLKNIAGIYNVISQNKRYAFIQIGDKFQVVKHEEGLVKEVLLKTTSLRKAWILNNKMKVLNEIIESNKRA